MICLGTMRFICFLSKAEKKRKKKKKKKKKTKKKTKKKKKKKEKKKKKKKKKKKNKMNKNNNKNQLHPRANRGAEPAPLAHRAYRIAFYGPKYNHLRRFAVRNSDSCSFQPISYSISVF